MSDNAWTCAGREEQAAEALEDLVNGVRLPLIRADTKVGLPEYPACRVARGQKGR